MTVFKGSGNKMRQLPASASCADIQDELNPRTQMCKAANPWALAYLRNQRTFTLPAVKMRFRCVARQGAPAPACLTNHVETVHAAWARCAKGLPGMAILRANADATGNFMYPYADKAEVADVYAACMPGAPGQRPFS